MDNRNIEVGQRITDLRKQRAYTREKLAELADISVQFLADIEKGRKSMTVNTLRKIAATLNVTTDYIVNGTLPATGDDSLSMILASMPEGVRKYAEKLLIVYSEAINQPPTNIKEKIPLNLRYFFFYANKRERILSKSFFSIRLTCT